MKRFVWRLVAGISVILIIVVVAGIVVMRASLPTLEGEITVPGLSAAATIERDAQGIPVIRAANRLDLAFATGFAHGQDRLFQMDMIRRQAGGELSAIVGPATINIDKRNRFHRFRARARAVIAAASDFEREFLQRYADGVNAGRDSLRARPFEYWVLGADVEPWKPEDSILVVYAMFMQLNDSRANKEIRRGLAHSVLPAELYSWMYPDGSPWDAPLIGEARAALPIPPQAIVSLRGVDDAPEESGEAGRYRLRGSNNWAVSGALTASGRAIVSNDMHLGLNTPNIYYRARLIVDSDEAVDIAGVSLPGAPFVIAGSNSRVAWGFTNSYGDYTDAVVLRPGERADTYITPEGERDIETQRELIEVKGAAPVELLVRETQWGPILDDVEYPDGEVVVSWIAHKADAVNLNIFELESAANVAAALDIANTMGMPPQNFVVGDADGNIGWTIAGKIPAKSGFDAMLPADWSEQQGWHGWVAAADYPRIVNPDSGRIWTANSRVVDAEALAIIGDGGYDLGARASQIRDGLMAQDLFTPQDMLRIQFDDRAEFLKPWRQLLLDTLETHDFGDNDALREYRQLVEDWIPRAAPESVGYRLVRAFRLEVERRLFHALTAAVRERYGDDVALRRSNQFEAALWSAVTQQPLHLLPADYPSWDAFLIAAMQQNINYFAEHFSGPLSERSWGEINTAAIRHPLARSIPLFGDYLNMSAEPLNGDTDMPKVQGPSMGASERFSVAPGDEVNSLLHMPTGQSGHPLSDYYAAGHADWVRGLASPFLPGTAQHSLTLVPDSR